jgi:hypothetical protein
MAEPFVGKVRLGQRQSEFTPGSDNESLNNPDGIDCDAQGRVYVADTFNNRVQVPEGHRHSIAILDTNGNLVMHLGRYGNYDDALAMKPGSEDIAINMPRHISGTDNYLALDNWGEGLMVLKLLYHAEETVEVVCRLADGRGKPSVTLSEAKDPGPSAAAEIPRYAPQESAAHTAGLRSE